MNANASTNDTNNMTTIALNPAVNNLLQAISGGGLSALEVFAVSGDNFPPPFPPLKEAVIEALAIIRILKGFKTNKKDWAAFSESLIGKIDEIVQATCQYKKSQVLLTLQPDFENLKGILDHLKEDVLRIQQQNMGKGLANFKKDQEHIEGLQGKINALPNFQACLRVEEVSQRGVNVLTQAHDFQIHNSVFNSANTININGNKELEAERANVEKWLQVLKAPSHGKPKERCVPGTREDVLTLIKTWLDDLNGPNIFWLSGSPGSGKTTIASTVVADFYCLSGQFFFCRDKAELQDPDNLWRRIALDLSLESYDLRKSIAQALETQKANIRGLDISMQFEHLIVKPLQQVLGTCVKPLLIVVDALDECDSYQKLLPSLVYWSHLPKSLKLLITSRCHKRIESELKCVSVHHNLNTGYGVSPQTSLDLEKYFVARFSEVPGVPPKLHSPAKVSFLVGKAAGLFIWAKSAMDFILYDGGDSEERLDIISADSGEGIDAVDSLYRQVISVALRGLRKPEETASKLVLGSIVIAKNPLCIKDLTELLGVKATLLNSIIGQLSPILSISDTSYLHVCHQTVADFLLDSERSQDLWVDHKLYSLHFAGFCLRFMNAKLKFNFFNLKTSYVLNKDIPELNDHLESVKSTALDHASYFWASYLQNTCDKELQIEVQSAVEEFLMVHLLHWLEVMSVMGTVNHVAELLAVAANWSKDFNPSLSDFAKDAERFVSEFLQPIAKAAPHIYLSALPFAPRNSKISMHFLKLFQKTLTVKMGQMECGPEEPFPRLADGVTSVAFSPDGRHIVFGSDDKTVRVWDAQTGQSIMDPLKGHNDKVTSVAFSSNGRHIVSGSWDRTVRVWDAQTGQSVRDPLQGHKDSISSVAFSPNGRHIVSGSHDDTVRVWDAQTGQSVIDPLKGHDDSVTSVADGRHIISGSAEVKVWDIQRGKSVINPPKGHGGWVASVALSPDGRYIVSGSDDKTVKVWDTQTGQSVMDPLKGHDHRVSSVAVSPNGRYIVSGSWDRTVRVWDTQTGQSVMDPIKSHKDWITSVAFSPDGRHIASGSGDQTVRVWDAHTGQGVMNPLKGHNNWVTSVAFSPNGRHIVSGSSDKTVRVWDTQTGQSVINGHDDCVSSVAFSPDGRHIVSGSWDRTVRVWDTQTGQIIRGPLRGHTDLITSVAFSSDGRHIVSGSRDETVRVWDALTGQRVMDFLRLHDAWIALVAFSPDGKHIVSVSGDETVRVFVMKGHHGCVSSVAFSPDGRYIVSGSTDKTVRVWDAQTGQSVIDPLKDHDGWVTSVAFSPDGRHIASGSCDRTVRVWDAQTGQSVIDPLKGHDNQVTSVAFSPDGKHIVSGSWDRTVRVWDVQTGQSMTDPLLHTYSEYGDNTDISLLKFCHRNGNWIMLSYDTYLLWLPDANKCGLFWPRTTTVIGCTPTLLQFKNFVHGINWSQCFSPLHDHSQDEIEPVDSILWPN